MGCNCGGSAKAARERRQERLKARRENPKQSTVQARESHRWTGPRRDKTEQ